MQRRTFAIWAVLAVAVCATVASPTPVEAEEASDSREIEVPPRTVTRTFVMGLTYTSDPFASVSVQLDVGGVSDPVTLSASVDGGEPTSNTASDGSDIESGELVIAVAPCPDFNECTQQATLTVVISRDEAPPDATSRTADLRVTGLIGVSDGLSANTNHITLELVATE